MGDLAHGASGAQPRMIEFASVTKRYSWRGEPALDGLSLAVGKGETVALVGPNGAGKTTAIRIAVGVLLPNEGTVRIDGEDIRKKKKAASTKIGWVSDSNVFDLRAKAGPLLRYLSGFYSPDRRLSTEEAHRRLDEAGLGRVSEQKLGTFSYGMRKRFALAAAMVGDPTTFLLDEPFEGLDPGGQELLRGWLDARSAAGCSVLLCTHRLLEVQRIARRIVVLNLGRVTRVLERPEFVDEKVTTVRISGPKLDPAAADLLSVLGEVQFDGSDLLVSGPSIDSAEAAQLLVTHGYRITQLRAEPKNLERIYNQTLGTSS